MSKINFKKLLTDLENNVMINSFQKGRKIKVVNGIIPMNHGKWIKSDFGKFIGKTFEFDIPLSINYYGVFKLSTGLIKKVEAAKEIFHTVKSVKGSIMYFNSVGVEHIKEYAPELYDHWPYLKKYVIDLRWKKK